MLSFSLLVVILAIVKYISHCYISKHDIYFVAPICQKLYSSCPHIPISKSLKALKEVNFNHFVVLTGWLLQQGRGIAAPGFLVRMNTHFTMPAHTQPRRNQHHDLEERPS
jgi:hypothetical protein